MRTAARIDANQPEIVKGLRRVGASVQHLHTLGKGCLDLLVGYRGVNYVIEIKDGSKPPSQRKMTKDELEWISHWRGQCAIAESLDDALMIIGAV